MGQTFKMHVLYGTYPNKVYLIKLFDAEFGNERVKNNVIY